MQTLTFEQTLHIHGAGSVIDAAAIDSVPGIRVPIHQPPGPMRPLPGGSDL